jgi:hypothetical protein
MEQIVRDRPGHLVLRLPQVAGDTPNPHTLLNFVYARVSRGERFAIWTRARRNIIDCDDVARVANAIVRTSGTGNEIINVANPYSHTMTEIVAAMEAVTGHRAVYDSIDRGSSYPIEVSRMESFADAAEVQANALGLPEVRRVFVAHPIQVVKVRVGAVVPLGGPVGQPAAACRVKIWHEIDHSQGIPVRSRLVWFSLPRQNRRWSGTQPNGNGRDSPRTKKPIAARNVKTLKCPHQIRPPLFHAHLRTSPSPLIDRINTQRMSARGDKWAR